MTVQLHFNIEKRIQLDFGQNIFPNHVCGEPEVFMLFCPNLKIFNYKQKIFIKSQITLLIHLVDGPNINGLIAILQFPFLPAKRPKMVFQLFSPTHKGRRKVLGAKVLLYQGYYPH